MDLLPANVTIVTTSGRRFPMFCTTQNGMVIEDEGIWFYVNPLKYVFPVLLTQVFLLFLVSRALYYILRPLKQPKFMCSVLAGIILGPSVLGRLETYRSIIFGYQPLLLMNTCSTIGVIYFIFLVGVKIDVGMILRAAGSAWKIGLIAYLSSFMAMSCLLLPFADSLPRFSKNNLFVLFFPAYASITNFPVVTQALDELNLMGSELGQLATSASMLNDTIQWFVMIVGIVFRQNNATQAIAALLSFLALLVFSFFVLRPMILRIKKTTPEGQPLNETYTVLIILGVLAMAALSDCVGIPYVHGPLILGLIIPDGPPIGAIVVEKVEAIISHFFLPLFFMQVGYSTDLSTIEFSDSFIKFELVIIAGYVAKMVGTFLTSLSCKISTRNSFLLGLIMNIEGIMELVAYSRWQSQKLIDDQYYTQNVLTTVVVTGIVTLLIEIFYKPLSLLRPHKSDSIQRHSRTIQTASRSAEFRILTCVHTPESVSRIITLLEASNPTPSSSISVYVIHLIELTGRAAPVIVPYKKRTLLSYTHGGSTDQIVRAFQNYTKFSKGPVSVEPYINVAHYRNMHETVCCLANDMNIPFIILPFHDNERHVYGNKTAAAVRALNVNIQNRASCTIGILVERGFQRQVSTTHFALNVAVIFLGGADDREALALASRMSENVDVNITLMRVTVWDRKLIVVNEWRDQQLEEIERLMDESAVDEFKMKNLGNACVVLNEVLVNDSGEGFAAIRAMENEDFDLFIVGKRHGGAAFVDEEKVVDFVEARELGVIGEMLASKDFRDGTATVLVTQHFGGTVNEFVQGSGYMNSHSDHDQRCQIC